MVERRMKKNEPRTIYTIGHSNLSIGVFLGLLAKHDIETVIDVRSVPFSSYNRHFSQGPLKNSLWKAGIEYIYLGDELGGHPSSREFYDGDRVVYERIARTREFRRQMRRVANRAAEARLVLMCAEEDPSKCHRHPLLTMVLLERGFQIDHIRSTGVLQSAASVSSPMRDPQLPLFETPGEDLTWRSPKRIR